MEPIKKTFVFDANNRKTAVQIDIQTFEKIEAILEDYGMEQLIRRNAGQEKLDIVEAETVYAKLDKAL